MVDPALFRLPSFSLGTAVLTLFYTGTINVYVVQTMFIQQGLGGSALLAGLVSLPPALATGAGSALAARWLGRRRGRVVSGGLLLLLLGLGMGALQTLSLEDVPAAHGGTAGGILQTGQRVGSAIGMAVVPGVWFASLPGSGPAAAHGQAYAVIAGFTVTALWMVLTISWLFWAGIAITANVVNQATVVWPWFIGGALGGR